MIGKKKRTVRIMPTLEGGKEPAGGGGRRKAPGGGGSLGGDEPLGRAGGGVHCEEAKKQETMIGKK